MPETGAAVVYLTDYGMAHAKIVAVGNGNFKIEITENLVFDDRVVMPEGFTRWVFPDSIIVT